MRLTIYIILYIVAILITFEMSPIHAQEKISTKKLPPQIAWQAWNNQLFAKAKQQQRYILLDLNARWCHWCHFMEKRTYTHPAVRGLIDKGFIATKVDQDASPDLSSRYGDWGWPATIIFDPEGKEIAKLQGFLRPSLMVNILNTILHHPENIPKLQPPQKLTRSETTFLNKSQHKTIIKLIQETYDTKHHGWGHHLKFLRHDVIEYALEQARLGDKKMHQRVKATLDASLTLMDKQWGGLYQYSHKRDWSAPHYEKIMSSQSIGLKLYARAYKQFGEQRYLKAAQKIYHYLRAHLQDQSGAFYTSQDADVNDDILGQQFYSMSATRRSQSGLYPTVDKNIYTRENAWAISGLLSLYNATGNKKYLTQALKAANYILQNRALPKGGFRHGVNDNGGPFLSDNIAMGTAMLQLYMSSGDEKWLKQAAKTSDFINANFKHEKVGYITSKTPSVKIGVFKDPFLNVNENIEIARFANLLYHTYGKKRFKHMADHALHYLTTDATTNAQRFLAGLLLADREATIEPAHVTVVGAKNNPKSLKLHKAALNLPISYKRIDWWDPNKGPMLNSDIDYPTLDKPALFACANQICSLPIFESKNLQPTLAKMMQKRQRAHN